ncbi:MAG: hypothetical protein ACLP7Q_17965 [Isosphaeraceae bacterium]
MLSVFSSPSRYVQGKGATGVLGHEIMALGLEGPVLITAGKTAIGQLELTWQRALGEAGLKYSVACFGGECSLEEIEHMQAAG